MTIRYLIDTAWVIDHLNEIERVVTRLKELRSQGLALSIVSVAELSEGSSTRGIRIRASKRSMPFSKMSPYSASTKRFARSSGENAAG